MCKTYMSLFFSLASPRHFLLSKIVFHTFISIMVIMLYLHFHFFWRARQWTSHIPSSSAPSGQGLNKKQHTTLVVAAACISNCFFVCLLLKAPLRFHDLTVSARIHISHFTAVRYQHVNTGRQGEAISFVSFPTEERFDSFCQPLSLKSSHSSVFPAYTEVWQEHRMADDLPYIASLIFHRQIIFQFGTAVCPRVSSSVFTQW